MKGKTKTGVRRKILGDKHYILEYIDVCRNCNGSGFPSMESLHHSKESNICTICKGSGRVVLKKEIKVELTPFKQQ